MGNLSKFFSHYLCAPVVPIGAILPGLYKKPVESKDYRRQDKTKPVSKTGQTRRNNRALPVARGGRGETGSDLEIRGENEGVPELLIKQLSL